MDKKHRKWHPMFDSYFESAVFDHGHDVEVLREIMLYRVDDLNLITKFHNAARWLNSDKVKKYFQERIKFYNEKDSLFE